jgi:putative transposase
MSRYIRRKRFGGTFFFTVTLKDRGSCVLVEHIDLLRECVRKVKSKRPFEIVAWVVLPDHMHVIWRMPEDDSDFSRRWQLIKILFTKTLKENTRYKLSVWQERFWEHEIRSDDDLKNHIHYCYLNPVKHGYVSSTRDWPYSSFHRDVKLGLFDIDWNGLLHTE